MDEERDTSLSEPRIERVEPEEVKEGKVDGIENPQPFLIVHGDGGEPRDEPGAFAECVLDVLVAAGHVSKETLHAAQEIVRNMAP